MINIINELNLENGSNHKMAVLKKHKDNSLLKRLLKMTYDKVDYTYGITMKNIIAPPTYDGKLSLEVALNVLENDFATRKVTGNLAIQSLQNLLKSVSLDDADILKKVINRDLRINMGRSNINKVHKNLITKPVYCRCAIYTTDKIVDGKNKKGTASNINFPAIIQLKADGTYREFSILDGTVNAISRSGEAYSYPAIEKSLSTSEDGYMTGELTVRLDDKLLEKILPKLIKIDNKNGTTNVKNIKEAYAKHKEENKDYILPRSLGNGLINSDDVPFDNLVYEVWDFITPEDYTLAGLKDKKNPPKVKYIDRFNKLIEVVETINNSNIQVIDHEFVNNLKEATDYTSKQMKYGLEGAILKDFEGLFKDGTAKWQLKMKIAFALDVKITGFIEGTIGTKREETFGSMTYETLDGMIKGSVSGFNDEQLLDFNSRREELIDLVMEIEGNDLTQGRGNMYYAVSHPRFIELRTDKTTTDDIERALEMLESAKEFK